MLESAYLILLFIIAFIEIGRKKSDKFDFLTLFNIYFSVLYPLPAFLLAYDFDQAASSLAENISLYTNSIQTALAIFVGYFVVVIGFYSPSAIKFGKNIIIEARKNDRLILGYAFFLLLFSCLSIHIYGLQYGGFLNALANTTLIRVQAIEGGNLVFFSRLTLFSIFASYLFCSFTFIKRNKKGRIWLSIIFLFSVVVTVIALTMTGGRSPLINYVIGFCLVYFLKNQKISWLTLSVIGCFLVLFLFYGKALFFSLTAVPNGLGAVIERFSDSLNESASGEFSFYNFMHNFQYPVFSLDVAFTQRYQLRWFIDFIYGLASLIPDRLLGTAPAESIIYYNSRYIIGNNDFSIPTGFLALGIYSLWWPGLIIICFTYGWIGRCLQTALNKHIHDIFWLPFIYVVIAQIWMDFVASDPETFFQLYFSSLTAMILLMLLGSKIYVVQRNSKA